MNTHGPSSKSRKSHWWAGLLAAALFGLACAGATAADVPGEAPAPPQAATVEVPSSETPTAPMSAQDVYRKGLRSTVWLTHFTDDKSTWGTGWVLDVERRLIVTNQHVVEGLDEMQAYFPVYQDGRLVSETKHYVNHVPTVRVQVLDSDANLDLAIVQADSLPEGTAALELAPASPSPGERVHTVGGFPAGSGGLWIYTQGIVRQVTRRAFINGFEKTTVEANAAINSGDSGGAVIDDLGRVIAVVQGRTATAQLQSVFIDVTEVRGYLQTVLPLLEPSTVAEFLARGERRMNAGRYSLAVTDFSEAVRRDVDFAAAYAQRGWAFHLQGDSRTAIGDFDEAIRLDRGMVEAHRGRGEVHRSLEQYEQAVTDFTNAIRLVPTSAELYNLRGLAEFEHEEYTVADTDYSRAIELDAAPAVFWANRGLNRQFQERFVDAAADYREAFSRQPESDEYVNRLGVNLYRAGQYDAAAEAFIKAIELNDKSPLYYANLGDAASGMEKHEFAVKAFTEAINRDGSEASHFNSRGLSYFNMEQYPEAAVDFAKAAELQPDRAVYWYNQGLSLKNAGRADLARPHFAKAAEIDPENYGDAVEETVAVNTQGNTNVNTNVNPNNRTGERTVQKPVVQSPVVGNWVFKGTINGNAIGFVAAMNAQGEYGGLLRLNGQDTYEAGTYHVSGTNIVFEIGGKTITRQFEMEQGRLWVTFPEFGKMLGFDPAQ